MTRTHGITCLVRVWTHCDADKELVFVTLFLCLSVQCLYVSQRVTALASRIIYGRGSRGWDARCNVEDARGPLLEVVDVTHSVHADDRVAIFEETALLALLERKAQPLSLIHI